MKNFCTLFLISMALLGLCACFAGTSGTAPTTFGSDLYSDAEIQAAIDVASKYFEKHFTGCTLKEITYAGDEITQKEAELAAQYDADSVIILTSSFDVAASGADGSLNPSSTYTDWKWILVRTEGSSWRHVDHGY